MKKATDWVGLLALLGVTALAAYLRFDQLALKPFHHDEGVNAWFVNEIIESFKYRYNPYYYHGPFLYFITAPFVWIFGKTPEAIRYAPALLGTLTVPALALFKPRLGWLGVLGAALLMAIAPVDVYFSRTAIHEIYNSTFNLTLVAGIYLFWRSGRRAGLYAAFLSLGLLFATKETTVITVAALVVSIVVTWYLAEGKRTFPGGAPLPTALLAAAPDFWRRRQRPEAAPTPGADADAADASAPEAVAPEEGWPDAAAPEGVKEKGRSLMEAIRHARDAARAAEVAHLEAQASAKGAGVRPPPPLGRGFAALANDGLPDVRRIPLVTFVYTFLKELWLSDPRAFRRGLWILALTIALLFSSFFTYWKGIPGFFEAFVGWGKTGVEGKGHEKVWSYFIDDVLFPYYQPLIVIGLPALIIGAYLRDAFALFNLLWFVLALTVYSIIPYKTPWCILSFITPLFLGVGIGLDGLVRWAKGFGTGPVRYALVAVPLLAGAPGLYGYYQQSLTLQYKEYDVDYHPIIYVQNVREYMELVDDMQGLLKALEGDGVTPEIYMIRAHNPIRWYIIDWIEKLSYVNEFNKSSETKVKTADIILAQRGEAKKVREHIDVAEYEVRSYHERPGQRLELFVKRPLWDAYLGAVKKGEVPAPRELSTGPSISDMRTRELREAEKE